jgi:hypothetical protein
MSGSGDVDGEVSGEEAAWRDLIARFDTPGGQGGQAVAAVPWPAREDLPDPGPVAAEMSADPDDPGRGASDGLAPPDRARIIRYAVDPRSYSPPEEVDEPYVPDSLPPAKMDAISKGAWAALICGPGYLLVGTLLGWTISGTQALAAIAAFIGGFVILVMRMGNRPPRDEDDDGAVL